MPAKYLQEEFRAEKERKDDFMMGEKWSADVLVEAVLEMVLEVAQSPVQDFRLVAAYT